jgi:hypothetical protein
VSGGVDLRLANDAAAMTDEGLRLLAGFLIRRNADRAILEFHFQH